MDISGSTLQPFLKNESQQPPLKHVFHPGEEDPLSLAGRAEGVGEQSQFRTQPSGMLWEGPPAPRWVLPSERAVQWYPSSKKSLAWVTLSPRFKAASMQLWHLALQGLKQRAIQCWVECSDTHEHHQSKTGSFVSAKQG